MWLVREGEETLLAAADYEMHVVLRGGAMVEGMKFLFLSRGAIQ